MTYNPLQHRLPGEHGFPQIKARDDNLLAANGKPCRRRVLPEPDAGDRAATAKWRLRANETSICWMLRTK